jgi:hypothetical protein
MPTNRGKSMYIWNGKPLQLRRTTRLERWSNCASPAWMKLRGLEPPVKIACGLMLLVLLGLCTGCGTLSASPTEAAKNPQPPQLSEPLPSESYLHKAQKLIESWQNAVTGM